MTLHHDLHTAGYLFNPTIQYKDNVHNDGEVMRGTMTVITRPTRTMNERLDVMAEVVPEIDVDELLNEEHPLHAWVETRAEGEIPDFHPDDRLVQACEEDVLLEEHLSTARKGLSTDSSRQSSILLVLCLYVDSYKMAVDS
ncbi:hypothetical protein Taro_021204 [Colocasia esculenta]|uniref:Uncharacterized protein n=1 Tax=Colocasia esculenta TaxID=4460 RepID=A0A843UYD2_COLES|nr:hypothetical protein [Colocasia esculenta]